MSSVLVPSHYPVATNTDNTCRRQSFSHDCCFQPFCKVFSDSGPDSCEKDIPDLRVLAQNSVDAYGIKEANNAEHTLKQPGRRSSDFKTDGSLLSNSKKLDNSSFFDVTLCGNRNNKDESDNGEKLYKEKPTYVYRVMQKDMKLEKNRLETYKNKWPLSYIDPSDLAVVGFFYLQCGDKVQCAFCRGIIVDWAPGDDPLTEHSLHFPLCPFLMNRDVGNIPISGKSLFVDRYNNSYPENSELFRQTSCSTFNGGSSSESCPKFPKMKSIERRLATFRGWQYPAVKAEDLVEAGFFYTGTSDIATCFHCGGTLGHWDVGDDPRIEHKKHFPYCAHLKSISSSAAADSTPVLQDRVSMPVAAAGLCDIISELMKSKLCVEASKIFSETLVQEALERQVNKNGQGFQSLEDLCSTILEIQDEAQKDPGLGVESQVKVKGTASSSGDRHMCKICWDKEMGIVFLPCGHIVSCPECAKSITKCPLCRRTIENTVRAYMS